MSRAEAPSTETLRDLEPAVWRLAEEAPVKIEPAGVGANSHTYRVTTATRVLALKRYPRRAGDQRDRLDVEWRALHFLRAQGLSAVPKPLGRNPDQGFMLMEWLNGQPVSQHRPEDLDAAIAFMIRIFEASHAPEARSLPPASEACLSAAEIIAQIEARLAAFAPHPDLEVFLERDFMPRLAGTRAALGREVEDGQELPDAQRRLIPADFGFHNALREPGGGLRFIDFDYLGWDDPVKLAIDFVLHPAMSLTEPDKRQVIERLAGALPEDGDFLARQRRHKPLYALRWALILLNPFRRDRLAATADDHGAQATFLAGQIEKAKSFCAMAT